MNKITIQHLFKCAYIFLTFVKILHVTTKSSMIENAYVLDKKWQLL